MSEQLKLIPNEIGQFLGFIAGGACSAMRQSKIKPDDMPEYLIPFLALIFLLAKRQPELADACEQYWLFTRSTTPQEQVDAFLRMYQDAMQEFRQQT